MIRVYGKLRDGAQTRFVPMEPSVLVRLVAHSEALVAYGDRRITRQNTHIANLEAYGRDTSQALVLLAELTGFQRHYVERRQHWLYELRALRAGAN